MHPPNSGIAPPLSGTEAVNSGRPASVHHIKSLIGQFLVHDFLEILYPHQIIKIVDVAVIGFARLDAMVTPVWSVEARLRLSEIKPEIPHTHFRKRHVFQLDPLLGHGIRPIDHVPASPPLVVKADGIAVLVFHHAAPLQKFLRIRQIRVHVTFRNEHHVRAVAFQIGDLLSKNRGSCLRREAASPFS